MAVKASHPDIVSRSWKPQASEWDAFTAPSKLADPFRGGTYIIRLDLGRIKAIRIRMINLRLTKILNIWVFLRGDGSLGQEQVQTKSEFAFRKRACIRELKKAFLFWCSSRQMEAERVDSARSYVRASDGVKCREAQMQTPARELIDEGVEVTDEDILPPTPSPSMDHLNFYETGYSKNIASTQF